MCYLDRHTGYSVAKVLYDVQDGNIPRTGKVYEAINSMTDDGYLTKDEGVYVAQVKPLAKEIQRIFEKFNIINYNQAPSHMKKSDKPLLVQDLGRDTELDLFELKILEELLSSPLTKQAIRMRVNTNVIKQSGGNFLLTVLRMLIEKAEMFETQFDFPRTHNPHDIYKKMFSGTFKTDFRYRKGLDIHKYFIKWKQVLEKSKINPEDGLGVNFPDMDLIWSSIQERYRYNKQVLKDDDSWISGYRDDAHFTLLMWLMPLLLINKFMRLFWEISEPDWSRLILGNPNEKHTTGRGFYLK